MGTPQRRRRIKRGFGRLALSAHFTARPGLARRRALHPPRRLMPNLTTGAMRNCLASPVSGALFGAIRGSTIPPSPFSLDRPCNYRRIGRASHTSSPATPCFGALGSRAHTGEMERIVLDGSLACNCRHEAHAQLPDPILQIFNSRLVGLGKCRMNQVSSQSGRMYKASRCPTPFWHESSWGPHPASWALSSRPASSIRHPGQFSSRDPLHLNHLSTHHIRLYF